MSIDHKPTDLAGVHLKGKTPEEIAEEFPMAVVRTYQQYGNAFCSKALYNDCLNEIKKRSAPHEYYQNPN